MERKNMNIEYGYLFALKFLLILKVSFKPKELFPLLFFGNFPDRWHLPCCRTKYLILW